MVEKSERKDWIEVIEGEVKIQYDKRQLFVRIPKEVSSYLKLNKGDKFKFIVEIPEKQGDELGLFFEIKGSKHGKN